MSIERDPNIDVSAARKVALGGHEFFVPPLSLRQILAIADYVPKLTEAGNGSEQRAAMVDVVWQGLRRAHPGLTRDELLDLPIKLAELAEAANAVIAQSGGEKPAEAAAGEA